MGPKKDETSARVNLRPTGLSQLVIIFGGHPQIYYC